MTTTRHLHPPLQQALEEAQAAFVGSGRPEIWVLPAGTHAIDGALELGAPQRRLELQGQADTRLLCPTGLRVHGSHVELRHLAVEARGTAGAALRLTASASAQMVVCEVVLESTAAAATVLSMEAPTLLLQDVSCAGKGADVVGLELRGEHARLSECSVSDLLATGTATGVDARISRLRVTDLRCSGLRGSTVTAVSLSASTDLDVLGMDIDDVRAHAMAFGLVAAVAGPFHVRGIRVRSVQGSGAYGVTVVGTARGEVHGADVHGVVATSTGATGMRVLFAGAPWTLEGSDWRVEDVRTDEAPWRQPGVLSERWAARASSAASSGRSVPAPPHTMMGVGVHVGGTNEDGAASLAGLRLHRIRGTALAISARNGNVHCQRVEIYAAEAVATIEADQLQLDRWTVHAARLPLLTDAALTFRDSIVTRAPEARVTARGRVVQAERIWSRASGAHARTLRTPSPYVDEGPSDPLDRLVSGDWPAEPPNLHLSGACVLEIGREPEIGARPILHVAACRFDDPLGSVSVDLEPRGTSPRVDYLARDARRFTELMEARMEELAPGLDVRDPADLTTAIVELMAQRMDHLAYYQERAVNEGYLGRATLRRSVEDHARPLDYVTDIGLSATAMISLTLDADALHRWSGLPTPDREASLLALANGKQMVIPAGTLVANGDPSDGSVVFATETPLHYRPELEGLRFREPAVRGATEVVLEGSHAGLVGRWMVFVRRGRPSGHVVRITAATQQPASTVVRWDPRRPLTEAVDDHSHTIVANVVPAKHGLPLVSLSEPGSSEPFLARWRALLTSEVDGRLDREVEVPFPHISVHAPGYPLPDAGPRTGVPQLGLSVNGRPWRRVDDLALMGPSDEVYALRAGRGGRQVVRFGDGVNGAALPQRKVDIQFELTVGRGRVGNVGSHTLQRLVAFGALGAAAWNPERPGSAQTPLRPDDLRDLYRFTNPLPPVGGRDPEPLAQVRYRAPAHARTLVSAVSMADYEDHLLAMPEVSGARARLQRGGLADTIRLTTLLRDIDTLPASEVARRWAQIRHSVEQVRLLGYDVVLRPPEFVALDIDLQITAVEHADAGRIASMVRATIVDDGGLLDPDEAGLGGDIQLSDLYRAALSVPGVKAASVLRFRRLEPFAPDLAAEGVLPIGDHEVVDPAAAVVTVQVCGGLQ